MATRFEMQSELFGLTPAQRNQAVTFVEAAVDGERINVTGAYVNRVQTIRGVTEYVAEISFTARASGERIFEQCRSWAATRAADSPTGQHSYVWLKEVQDVEGQVLVRRAESPGWIAEDSVEQMLTAE